MASGEPDAVRQTQVGGEEPLVREVLDLVAAPLELAHGQGFVPLLQGMGVDRPLRGSAGTPVGNLSDQGLRPPVGARGCRI